MQDTPQSCGLPSIEEYRNDYPKEKTSVVVEHELSAKEILFKYVLSNRVLWYIAIANIFVYFLRYGVVDWAPTYLQEVKHFSVKESYWAYFLYEWAGIPGILVSGWVSDKLFGGRRAPATITFMVGVLIAVIVYWKTPEGYPLVDNLALIAIGFLIYGPVVMIGLHAADLVPKKATGSATGLTGLTGYLIGSTFAGTFLGLTVDLFGWDGGFYALIGACVLSIVLLFMALIEGTKVEKE